MAMVQPPSSAMAIRAWLEGFVAHLRVMCARCDSPTATIELRALADTLQVAGSYLQTPPRVGVPEVMRRLLTLRELLSLYADLPTPEVALSGRLASKFFSALDYVNRLIVALQPDPRCRQYACAGMLRWTSSMERLLFRRGVYARNAGGPNDIFEHLSRTATLARWGRERWVSNVCAAVLAFPLPLFSQHPAVREHLRVLHTYVGAVLEREGHPLASGQLVAATPGGTNLTRKGRSTNVLKAYASLAAHAEASFAAPAMVLMLPTSVDGAMQLQ